MNTRTTHTGDTPPKSRKALQSEATREKLVVVARELFAERGYAGTSMEEVVLRAGVTRGALYHQFEDKRDLFRAVVRQVERDVGRRVRDRVKAANRGWERLVEMVQATLEAYAEPDARRIVLLEAPAALGVDRLDEIQEGRDIAGRLARELQRAIDAGVLVPQPARPLAHLLIGALREAARVIAGADDPEAAREELRRSYLGVLNALRTPEAPPVPED